MPKELLFGDKYIIEKLGEYEFEISADSFFKQIPFKHLIYMNT